MLGAARSVLSRTRRNILVVLSLSVLLGRGHTLGTQSLTRSMASGGQGSEAGKYVSVFVTTPSMDVAKKLSHSVVRARLAACVNIFPSVTSVYEWEGKVCEDQEQVLMMKTTNALVSTLSEHVISEHPYDVPEVIALPIASGSGAYLKWIGETTSKPPIATPSAPATDGH